MTTINDNTDKPNYIFRELKNYVYINPKIYNGFKIMNDKDETMKLMLPDIKNQGEEEA